MIKRLLSTVGILTLSLSIALASVVCCCTAHFVKKAFAAKTHSCCDAKTKDTKTSKHGCLDCSMQVKAKASSLSYDTIITPVFVPTVAYATWQSPSIDHVQSAGFFRSPPKRYSQPLFIQFHTLRI